ncbi:MAG TPA: DUF4189 domain-containing protein [Mycobacterium sp.]|jgi:hypothetical protein
MPIIRSVSAVLAAGVVAAGAAMVAAGPAWADGPGGEIEGPQLSRAVGSGVVDGDLVGYSATGATNAEAEAAVIAVCQNAGATECTSDEVTNGPICIVSVGAEDGSGMVAGGAGETIDEASTDAFQNASEFEQTLDPGSSILASSCA